MTANYNWVVENWDVIIERPPAVISHHSEYTTHHIFWAVEILHEGLANVAMIHDSSGIAHSRETLKKKYFPPFTVCLVPLLNVEIKAQIYSTHHAAVKAASCASFFFLWYGVICPGVVWLSSDFMLTTVQNVVQTDKNSNVSLYHFLQLSSCRCKHSIKIFKKWLLHWSSRILWMYSFIHS